jgi:hypothetical protein
MEPVTPPPMDKLSAIFEMEIFLAVLIRAHH